MTHIKALKLARDCIRDSVEYKQGKATAVEAVEDIEEALAQPQQEPPFSVQQAYAMAQVCLDIHAVLGCAWGDNVYLTISQLIAQPQRDLDAGATIDERWYITRKPKQEPVAYEYGDDIFWHNSPDINDYIRANGKALVYTSPPQRTWIGLTDEEITEVWRELKSKNEAWSDLDFARAIEAKLKEKNT